jgi:VWFA-related protein
MSLSAGVTASLLVSIAVALPAQDLPTASAPSAEAAAHIELASLGYTAPSRMERLLGDEVGVTVDFVDAKHVLLTFDRRKLLKRLPDCPSTHEDRMIHAVIIEIPGGKAVREADWYLHDRRQYLWPLGDGRFLLRKLNSLYLVDSSLQEQLLLNSPKDVVWLTVSADRKQVILETKNPGNDAKKLEDDAPQAAEKPNAKFQLDFFDIDSHTSQQTIESKNLVHLNAAGTGYADVLRKGDLWLIRFGPTPAQRRSIARVRSRCTPEVFYSSKNSLLIGRCSANLADYSVTAFTLTGHRLWRQHWKSKRFSPAVVHSDDDRRIAVNSFSVPQSTAPAPAADEDETDTGPQQNIQILETASGETVQSFVAAPAMVSAQNFSLSPDGMQFAILHDSQIELYDLPKVSAEEQAKFTALQADVPGLYIASKTDSDAAVEAEEPTDIAEDAPPPAAGSDVAVPAIANAPSATFSQAGITPAPLVPAKSNPSLPPATFKASAQAVVVDVVVTDAKGHPIKGLRQQDFQLEEDGKPQSLHYFREFGEAKAAPIAPPPAKPSPNVFTNITSAPDPGSVTLILLDLLNTPPADQQFARKQLVKFLKTKPANVQFALCTLSRNKNQRLSLIQGFTPDENLLLAAVNSGKATAQTMSFQSAVEAQNAVNSVRELAQSDRNSHWENLLSGLQKMQEFEKESDTSERAGLTVDALSQLARYLSGIPGRKNLVWLSGSFPVDFAPNPEVDMPSIESHNYSGLVRQAANLLAQGQVSVYPVDVRGLMGADLSAAANNVGLAPLGTQSAVPLAVGQATRDGTLAKPGQTILISPNETFQDQTMQALSGRSAELDAMNLLAQGTGGKAFYNSNAIEDAIATAVEQGTNYYTLSYTSANKNYDGRFRKIKVSLAQKGYHLHYRPGYFADDPHAPAKNASARDLGLAAMQHGSPQSRQILFAARVVPVGPKKKVDSAGSTLIASRKKTVLPAAGEVQHYVINFAVDSSRVRFIPQENGDHNSTLNLMMAAYDQDGQQLTGQSSVWAGSLNPAAYKDVLSGGVRIEQQLDVPVQAVSLRLGIADQMSNFLGTLELPLPVPVPTDTPRIGKHSLPEIEPD